MKIIILLFSLLALISNALAKTNLVLQNTTGAVIKFENKKTVVTRIPEDGVVCESFTTFMGGTLDVTKLNAGKGQTETTASSQSINPGCYFLKFYYGKKSNLSDLSGPLTVFFEVKRDNNYNAIGLINVDEVLPCGFFPKRGSPIRCRDIRYNDHNINVNGLGGNDEPVRESVRFKDQLGNWWKETGRNTARRIGNKTGKGAHKAWDTLKDGAKNVKDGWNNYKK